MNSTIATDIAVRDTEKYSSPDNPKNLRTEKRRLYKAAKEMESLFMYQLLKSMRSTIPKTDEDGKIGLGGDMGKDMYTQLFDQELSSMMAGGNDKSIADVIYRSMEKALELEFSANENKPVEIKNILPTRSYIKIKEDIAESPSKNINTEKIQTEKKVESKDETSKYDKIIDRVANKYKLQPSLLKAIIKAESAGNPKAVSSAGAKGLMQLADTTAVDMGVEDVFDPHENIEGGARYLRQMIDRFGDIKKALAAYNAGPGTVARYGDIPPYPETRRYVRTILDSLDTERPYY
jgi:Rod binding domain-containing protein